MRQSSQNGPSCPSESRKAARYARGRERGAAVVVGLFTLALAGCMDVPVPDPLVRYIAFGDSSTAGPSDRDYADVLRDMLAEPPEAFANEGRGGETAAEGLERLRFLLDNRIYPNAHALLYWEGGAPVVDFIGEVDPLLLLSPDSTGYPFSNQLDQLLNDIQGQVEAAIEAAQNAGLAVYVATYYMIPPFVLPCERLLLDLILPLQAGNGNAYIARLNEHLRQAAANRSAILIDVAAIEGLSADPGNFFDCNHLSTEGNQIVAERFFEVLGP